MNSKIKTGIMGGTFNPIHYGHLLLAEEAAEFCKLDEVIFMPSGNPYMKKQTDEILDGKIRLEMTKLAISENPLFLLSDMELNRNGPSYTCDTIRILNSENIQRQIFFIVGADSLFSIDKWRCPEEIFSGCSIIAASRGARTEPEMRQRAEWLKNQYGADIYLLPDRRIDLSSSEIRDKLFTGKSIRYMVPLKVREFIYKNNLYQMPEDKPHEIS